MTPQGTPAKRRSRLRCRKWTWGNRLSKLRWLLVVLAITATMLQVRLWLSDDGYRKTLNLRTAVADQRAQNQSLQERNAALDAEVINLKQSLEAAEERARTDLGMIGPKETFYQVVPVADAAD